MPLLSVDDVRAKLPKVGDELLRVPTLNGGDCIGNPGPRPCVVDYVNEEHLWYRVRFRNGVQEAYKLNEGRLQT